MEQLHLPAASRAQGSITLPGSKSISNRTLLLAAMASGCTEIRGLLLSDDTERMIEGLQRLGVKLARTNNGNWIVQGVGGTFPVKKAEIFLGNAGTALRPLTAVLSVYGGDYTLSGVPRMHKRPIKDLVDALRLTGSNIEYLENEGFPPLKINNSAHPSPLHKSIKIRGNVSSQFLTAILIALPLRGEEFAIEVLGELISKPYIQITINLMAKFGVTVINDKWKKFTIKTNCHYHSPDYINVEGDASSASYFLAAGAIAGSVTVCGISQDSIQGDVKFADALILMGADVVFDNNQITSYKTGKLKAIDLDCNHIPDAAMTLAILALFADGTSTLRNIASWRVKETDRLSAMATELRKVGAIVVEGADYLTITPTQKLIANAVIDTYDDHRMAMCFSLVSLGGVPITINDPKCVNKTFPNYFDAFKKLVS